MKYYKLFYIFSFALLFSCKTKQNGESDLNYLQNIESIAKEAAIKNSKGTIQPGDQLVIFVTAKDMDVVRPFNQNYAPFETSQSGITGTSSLGVPKSSGPTYLVNSDGMIEFPNIGQVATNGLTIEELKIELQNRISDYVVNPVVNIKHTNFVITILGEVNRPGDYNIPNGQATIFNALGLAGDVNMYGKREEILIVRTEDGVVSDAKINLKDAQFINSPYYQLKQGDVIYVPSNKVKEDIAKQNPNTGIVLAAAGLAVSAIAIVVSLLAK